MKLLIADDHTLFRDVLVKYIERAEPGAEITAVRNFPEALSAMEKGTGYDTVLLDLQMPGMNGMEGFKTMRRLHPDVPVALMSGVAETGDVREAMALGVAGYFPKTISGEALLKAIHQVLSGGLYVPPGRFPGELPPSYYANGDSRKKGTTAKNADNFGLTRREKEVLNHLVRGVSNKEIANALGLQVVTVKLHVHSLCRKLGVKNRTQAALLASAENIAE